MPLERLIGEGTVPPAVPTGELGAMMTIRQAATLLNVHLSTLRRWEKVGLLEPFRIGPRAHRRYTRDQIESLLVRSGKGSTPPLEPVAPAKEL